MGKYEGALATPNAWDNVWNGPLVPGNNAVPMKLELKSGSIHSIYLWVSRVCLGYSDKPCTPKHTLVRELGNTTNKGFNLICNPGRCLSVTPFKWPENFQQGAYLEEDQRFFTGDIGYTTVIAA